MLKLIRKITKAPRIAGYNKKTAEFLAKELEKSGYKARIQTHSFIGWENIQKPNLKINGKPTKCLPLIWTPSGNIKGNLRKTSRIKTFEAYEWLRWKIIDKNKTVGYIISRPDIIWQQLIDKKSKLPYFMTYPNTCKQLTESKKISIQGKVKNKFIKGLKIYNIITKNNSKNKIIVCAHYDSMLGTVGANDNASGVAALFELAKKYKDRDDIQFILFDAEEWNKSGSYDYVKSLNKEQLKNIKAVINLDMIGAGKPFVICSKKFNKLIKGIKPHNDIKAPFDIWPFYKKGIGVIHFGCSPYKYCHDPKDTIDKISSTPIKKVINIASNIINKLLYQSRL